MSTTRKTRKPRRLVLTQKQRTWGMGYIECGNKSEAYRRAYDCTNMKAETIHVRASELSRLPQVIAWVRELRERPLRRHDISVDRTLEEVSILAHSDLTEIVGMEDGLLTVRDFESLTPSQRRCIKSVKQTKDGIQITLHSKSRAIEFLGKHQGLLREEASSRDDRITINLDMGARESGKPGKPDAGKREIAVKFPGRPAKTGDGGKCDDTQ